MSTLSELLSSPTKQVVDPVESKGLRNAATQQAARANPFLSTLAGTLQGTVGGGSLTALGNATGALGLKQASEALYRKGAELQADAAPYMAPQLDYTTVKDVGSAVDFGLANAAQGVGSMAPMLLGRAVGGAPLGLAAGLLPQQGENVSRIKNDPTLAGMSEAEILGAAAPTAALQTGLDYIVPGGVATKYARQGAAKLGTGALGKAGATVGTNALIEGTTELGQEELGMGMHGLLNPNRDTAGDEHARIQSFLGGAVGGAPMGAIDAGVGYAQDKFDAKPPKPLDISKESDGIIKSRKPLHPNLTDTEMGEALTQRDAQESAQAEQLAQRVKAESQSPRAHKLADEFLAGDKSGQAAELFVREVQRADKTEKWVDGARAAGVALREQLNKLSGGRLGSAYFDKEGQAHQTPSYLSQEFRDMSYDSPNAQPDEGMKFDEAGGVRYQKPSANSPRPFRPGQVTNDQPREYGQRQVTDNQLPPIPDEARERTIDNLMLAYRSSDLRKRAEAEAEAAFDIPDIAEPLNKWIELNFGADLNDGDVVVPQEMIKMIPNIDQFVTSLYNNKVRRGEPVPAPEMLQKVLDKMDEMELAPEFDIQGRKKEAYDEEGADNAELFDEIGTNALDPNIVGTRKVYYGKSDKKEVPFKAGDEAALKARAEGLAGSGMKTKPVGAWQRLKNAYPNDDVELYKKEDQLLATHAKEAYAAMKSFESKADTEEGRQKEYNTMRRLALETVDREVKFLEAEDAAPAERSEVSGEDFRTVTPKSHNNRWAVSTQGVKTGKFYGGPEHGAVWFKRASDGTEFATSVNKLIKLGRQADNLSGKKGVEEQKQALLAGISSFLNAKETNGKPALMGFGFKSDPKAQVELTDKLPANLKLHSGSFGDKVFTPQAQGAFDKYNRAGEKVDRAAEEVKVAKDRKSKWVAEQKLKRAKEELAVQERELRTGTIISIKATNLIERAERDGYAEEAKEVRDALDDLTESVGKRAEMDKARDTLQNKINELYDFLGRVGFDQDVERPVEVDDGSPSSLEQDFANPNKAVADRDESGEVARKAPEGSLAFGRMDEVQRAEYLKAGSVKQLRALLEKYKDEAGDDFTGRSSLYQAITMELADRIAKDKSAKPTTLEGKISWYATTLLEKGVDAMVATVHKMDTARYGEMYRMLKRVAGLDKEDPLWGSEAWKDKRDRKEASKLALEALNQLEKPSEKRLGSAMSVDIHNDLGKKGFAATHDSPIRHEGKFDWRKNWKKGQGDAEGGAGTYLSTSDFQHKVYKRMFTGRASRAGDNRASPTYEVTVRAEPDEIMSFDVSVDAQNSVVRDKLLDIAKSLGIDEVSRPTNRWLSEENMYDVDFVDVDNISGAEFYHEISNKLGGDDAASNHLQRHGIVGHTFVAKPKHEGVVVERNKPVVVIYDDSRIETNYVHFNAQSSAKIPVGDETLTAEQKAEIRAAVTKRLGEMELKLSKELFGTVGGKRVPLSADWGPGSIRIAANIGFTNAMQAAMHEGMHEFFDRLSKEEAGKAMLAKLLAAANSASVVRQLERLLADHPNAKMQIKEGQPDFENERLAYMYQFWQAGALKVGPETKTIFQRIFDYLRGLSKLLSDDQQAELILQAFDEGRFSDKTKTSVAAKAVMEDMNARRNMVDNVVALAQGPLGKARELVVTAHAILAESGVKEFKELANMFDVKQGERAHDGKQGMFEARKQMSSQFLNKLKNVLDKLEKKDAEAVLQALFREDGKAPKDMKQYEAYKALRAQLDELHEYFDNAGVKKLIQGEGARKEWVKVHKREYYFPVVWELDGKEAEFAADLVKYHQREIMERLKDLGFEDYKESAKHMEYATAIAQRMTQSQGVRDLSEIESSLGFSPLMTAINERTLDWITAPEMSAYRSQDLKETMTSYIMQAVKRAEYVRRFGNGAAVIKDKMLDGYTRMLAKKFEKLGVVEAEKLAQKVTGTYSEIFVQDGAVKAKKDEKLKLEEYGVTQAQVDKAQLETMKEIKPFQKAVMAMEGTLGHDISENLRSMSNAMIVYQNFRLLAMTLFSSMSDPLGIVVRGGDIDDAYQTMQRGFKEVWKRWKADSGTDDATALAEMIGSVDAGMFAESLGQTYSSLYMSGKTKWLNDQLFKWNGMEAWNRGMRVGATQAAIKFIKKHLTKPNKDSERFLKELFGEGYNDRLPENLKQVTDKLDADLEKLKPEMPQLVIDQNKPEFADVQKKHKKLDEQRTLLSHLEFFIKHGTMPPQSVAAHDVGDVFKQAEKLGVTFKSRYMNADGELNYTDPLVQQAIMRWVDGAILSPNAAQRPMWASDPHYGLFFHMKQFAYSYHRTILKRAWDEAVVHGNAAPTLTLIAGYVPLVIAADAAKSIILSGGDEPYWMQKGVGSTLWHGMARANLAGIPQIGLDGFGRTLDSKEGVFDATLEGVASVAGPTTGWAKDWYDKPVGDQFVKSLPLGSVVSSIGGQGVQPSKQGGENPAG